MTTEELLAELNRLSLDERLDILEQLSRNIRHELHSIPKRKVPVEEVLGLLKPDGPMPTDEELKRDYIDYLENKYS
jgi:hypothetical protein